MFEWHRSKSQSSHLTIRSSSTHMSTPVLNRCHSVTRMFLLDGVQLLIHSNHISQLQIVIDDQVIQEQIFVTLFCYWVSARQRFYFMSSSAIECKRNQCFRLFSSIQLHRVHKTILFSWWSTIKWERNKCFWPRASIQWHSAHSFTAANRRTSSNIGTKLWYYVQLPTPLQVRPQRQVVNDGRVTHEQVFLTVFQYSLSSNAHIDHRSASMTAYQRNKLIWFRSSINRCVGYTSARRSHRRSSAAGTTVNRSVQVFTDVGETAEPQTVIDDHVTQERVWMIVFKYSPSSSGNLESTW